MSKATTWLLGLRRLPLLAAAAFALAIALPAGAQTPGICADDFCSDPTESICDAGGFQVSFVDFQPPASSTSGTAQYTYQICSPAAGVCTGDGITACLDNNKCNQGGNPAGGTCTRQCAVDQFRGLSHFDVFFPELGGIGSCLSASTTVTGSCTCSGTGCSVGDFTLGDGSCDVAGPQAPVAKCDNTELPAGTCILMTINIAGELNGLGAGGAVVLSKESTDCNESCILGPSCEPCDERPPGDNCLTRTIGFWGTHPWITNDYDPVSVCGVDLVCAGLADSMSDPSCPAGWCDSIMEGLCSVGGEDKRGAAYIAMVRQMTAAKLNLNASSSLFGASCGAFSHDGKTIQEWITTCEGLCDGTNSAISSSGCIEALDAFNRSEDTGFDVTPSPFDRPSVDDFGNVSGADPSGCTTAQGNQEDPVLVIDKNAKPAIRNQRQDVVPCK